jgi:hypothetical protein
MAPATEEGGGSGPKSPGGKSRISRDSLNFGDTHSPPFASWRSAFDALPKTAQRRIIRVLAAPPSGAARPASEAALEVFASLPEQAELVAEWGRNAKRNLAIAESRMSMILKGCPRAPDAKLSDGLTPCRQVKRSR